MKIRHLKLYHYPATRSARVKWMLHEVLDDAFEVEVLDLYAGRQYSPEFLEKNPNHNVPLLEITWEDGRVQRMLESGAMVAFLADAFPEKKLAPAPDLSAERADYLQMMSFGSSWMDMMLWQVRIHEHVLTTSEKDQRTIARYRRKFEQEAEPQIEARLERSTYICGEDFTAADCVIGHNVFWASGYGMCRRPAFQRYIGALSARPAFLQAFSDMANFTVKPPENAGLATRFTG